MAIEMSIVYIKKTERELKKNWRICQLFFKKYIGVYLRRWDNSRWIYKAAHKLKIKKGPEFYFKTKIWAFKIVLAIVQKAKKNIE